METTLIQLGITLLTVFSIFLGWYNKLSDPIEKTTGKPYSFKSFFIITWSNGLYYTIAGFVLLIVLKDGGMVLLKYYVELPDMVETIGDLVIAVISGLMGHKLINKFI